MYCYITLKGNRKFNQKTYVTYTDDIETGEQQLVMRLWVQITTTKESKLRTCLICYMLY